MPLNIFNTVYNISKYSAKDLGVVITRNFSNETFTKKKMKTFKSLIRRQELLEIYAM